MQEQGALEPLSFERPLPCDNAGDHDWYGGDRRDEKVIVGCRSQHAVLRPVRQTIEQNARDEQGDGKVNQHHMLGVLREKYRF